MRTPEINCIEHITTEGERWDQIAWRYYGDAAAISRIVEANPAINISATIPSGTLVLVPILPVADTVTAREAEELPPWKR